MKESKVFVPTQKNLDYVEGVQNKDNVKLDYIRENIAKAVCIIARMMYDTDADVADEAALIIQQLGYIHYELKNLESE